MGVTLQAGAMQWTAGSIQATTGVKGVGDFFAKAIRGSVTGESAIKPECVGVGTVVCEPTYRHILLMSPRTEMGGTMVVNDGLFMACTSDIQHRAIMVKRPSAVVAGACSSRRSRRSRPTPSRAPARSSGRQERAGPDTHVRARPMLRRDCPFVTFSRWRRR